MRYQSPRPRASLGRFRGNRRIALLNQSGEDTPRPASGAVPSAKFTVRARTGEAAEPRLEEVRNESAEYCAGAASVRVPEVVAASSKSAFDPVYGESRNRAVGSETLATTPAAGRPPLPGRSCSYQV
jgi:hypothetical protein